MSSATNRNYKVIYDPELDFHNQVKKSAHVTFQYEQELVNGQTPKDPRPFQLVDYEKRSRLFHTSLNVVSFDDQKEPSINPHCIVLVSRISPLSTESQIITVLSVYGEVNRVEIIQDPATGGPLGLAKVTFEHEQSADLAIKNGNGRRIVISDSIKIEHDLTGEKLKAALKQHQQQLSPVEKIPDSFNDEEGELLSSAANDDPKQQRRRYSLGGGLKGPQQSVNVMAGDRYSHDQIPPTQTAVDANGRKKPSRWGRPITTAAAITADPIQRSFSNYQDYRLRPIYHRARREISPPILPSDQKSYVKAVISRDSLPFMRGVIEELERLFYPFGYVDIYHDAYDWFIVFDSKTSALQAQRSIYNKNQRVLGYSIDLSIPSLKPDYDVSTAGATKSTLPQQASTTVAELSPKDVSLTAKQILFVELADIFLKDVKNRVAGPCIYDFLNPASVSKRQHHDELKPAGQQQQHQRPIMTSIATSTTTAAAALESDIVANAQQLGYDLPALQHHQHEENVSIYKLPRFKKKSTSQRSFDSTGRKSMSSSPPPVAPHFAPQQQPKAFALALSKKTMMKDEDEEDEDVDIGSNEEEKLKLRELSPQPPFLQQQPRRLSDYMTENKPRKQSFGGIIGTDVKKEEDEEEQDFLSSILPLKKKQKTSTTAPTQPKKQQHVKFGLYEDDNESDTSDDMAARKKRRSKSPAVAPTTVPFTTTATTTTTTIKKRKVLKQRRPSIKRKSSSASINMVIEETPSSAHKTTHKSPSHSTVNSPSTNMDIDIDGVDDESLAAEEQQQQPLKNILVNRNRKEKSHQKEEEEEEFDQATLEKILQEVDNEEGEIWDQEEEEDVVDLSSEFDPFSQTKDVEDLEYLRVAIIEKVDPSSANTFNNALEKLEKNEKRMSQSARTRGYYPIPDSVKATYLPKNKAVFEPAAVITSTSTTKSSATTPPSSGRSNRVHKRRLMAGMVIQNKAMADLDILKFNQLKSRKKRLRFSKSPIHDWGLYAQEHIDANDMVIEYVGEVIRQQIAEERERHYEKCGIGSSYLFRIDEDTVIDATKKGSIARFINHCCAPNCSAKIITVEKQKKIVIYANRDIEPGEEITYNYKFPLEADKIPCLCGSKFCKGTLN